MSKRILIADDDDDARNSHKLALREAAKLLNEECLTVETGDSVDTKAKMQHERFDLILLDNEFKDSKLKGHLPGIGLLQLARKEGPNKTTPIIFCSAESFENLKPMVERFGGVYFPKATYDIDEVARLFADQILKPRE
jgi:CheY-like chemotaxis protein